MLLSSLLKAFSKASRVSGTSPGLKNERYIKTDCLKKRNQKTPDQSDTDWSVSLTNLDRLVSDTEGTKSKIRNQKVLFEIFHMTTITDEKDQMIN